MKRILTRKKKGPAFRTHRLWGKFLRSCFRAHGLFEKKPRLVIIAVIIGSIILLWLAPVRIGTPLIVFVAIFLIGAFDPRKPKKSVVNLCMFLVVLCVFSSPYIGVWIWRSTQLNNPAQLLNRTHPKILDMTAEFENEVPENTDIAEMLHLLERYVYREIPYDYTFNILPSPYAAVDDVMKRMTATCWGRALVGYCILKNMGHDVYIAGSYVGGHWWLRVYENGGYFETFTVGESRNPWVEFNETNVHWGSHLDEIGRAFFEGFEIRYWTISLTDLFVSFLLAAPIALASIYILVWKRNTNFSVYLAAVVGAWVAVTVFRYISVISWRMMLPVFIIIGGIYLRILYLKIKPRK